MGTGMNRGGEGRQVNSWPSKPVKSIHQRPIVAPTRFDSTLALTLCHLRIWIRRFAVTVSLELQEPTRRRTSEVRSIPSIEAPEVEHSIHQPA
jgi:hypothetical protein